MKLLDGGGLTNCRASGNQNLQEPKSIAMAGWLKDCPAEAEKQAREENGRNICPELFS
jgi:hypothetical protein